MAFEIALLARPMTDPPSDLLEFLPLATRKRAKLFTSSTRLRELLLGAFAPVQYSG